jgi:hypothetical protein
MDKSKEAEDRSQEAEAIFASMVTDTNFRIKIALHCYKSRKLFLKSDNPEWSKEDLAKIGKPVVKDR